MSPDQPLSRRIFLASGAAAGALVAVPGSAAAAAAVPAAPQEERLRRLCRTLAGGRTRARAVARVPADAVDVLCRQATGRALPDLAAMSDGEVFAAIAAETRRAFRAGAVEQIHGWVLSRSELAVYRLAAG